MTDEKRSTNPLALVLLLSGGFFMLFLMLSGLMYVYKSPGASDGSGSSSLFGRGSVGVVEVNGVILDSKKTLAKLEKFEENEQVKAVVVRLNSPGGAVAPSQEIYQAVKNYKKPLVVSMGSIAASGAFYVACGAKKVYANPGTMTGSIGVIMEFANLEKLYQWAKIQRYVVKTGKFKDVGAEYREMTPEEKGLIQRMVDDVLGQFKSAIATGRKLSMEQVTQVADGRIFSGSQAKEAHLVDELGTITDAIQEAAKLGGIKGKPSVVYGERQKRGWMDFVMDDSTWTDGSDSSLAGGGIFRVLALLRRLGDQIAPSEQTEASNFVPGLYWLLGTPGLH